MKNSRFKKWLFFSLLSLIFFSVCCMILRFRQDQQSEYIILVGIDTLRADHLSCYGYQLETSPSIDEFAKGAILFQKSISQSSWTLPSFASIFTSLYYNQHKSGFQCLRNEKESMLNTTILEDSFTTLAEVLKSHGYKTAAFTEGALMSPFFGVSQGFDLFKICSVPEDKIDELNPKQIRFKNIKNVVDESLKWINKNRGRKFFLFLHSYETHKPLRDPMGVSDIIKKEYVKNGLMTNPKEQFELKVEDFSYIYEQLILYDSEIRYLDYHLGRFFSALKDMDIYDKSLIIFTSDHGEEFGEHGGWGHGKALYRESVFVPLIVKLPYQKKAVQEDRWTAQGIDIFPTILELSGIKNHNYYISGRSLLSKPSMDIALTHHFGENGNFVAVVKDGQKLIFNYDSPRDSVLFDLTKDPFERHNILSIQEGKSGLTKFIDPVEIPTAVEGKCPDLIDEDTKMKLKGLGYIQ